MLKTASSIVDAHQKALDAFGFVRGYGKHLKPEASIEKLADGLFNLTVMVATLMHALEELDRNQGGK